MSDRYILLCMTSDTIVGISTGTFDDMTITKSKCTSVSDATGTSLAIESLHDNFEEQDITSTGKLMELYGHLLTLDKEGA